MLLWTLIWGQPLLPHSVSIYKLVCTLLDWSRPRVSSRSFEVGPTWSRGLGQVTSKSLFLNYCVVLPAVDTRSLSCQMYMNSLVGNLEAFSGMWPCCTVLLTKEGVIHLNLRMYLVSKLHAAGRQPSALFCSSSAHTVNLYSKYLQFTPLPWLSATLQTESKALLSDSTWSWHFPLKPVVVTGSGSPFQVFIQVPLECMWIFLCP